MVRGAWERCQWASNGQLGFGKRDVLVPVEESQAALNCRYQEGGGGREKLRDSTRGCGLEDGGSNRLETGPRDST